jgi:YggT family protein
MIYLANVVRLLFSIYIILIFIRVFFAWIRPNMFNPIVRFVYKLTDPYLKIFAGLRFLRIGAIDLSPLLAFYLLYLLQELCYNVILRGHISPEFFVTLVLTLLFRFIYFILFIFMIAVGLRLIFDIARIRSNNFFITAVYSISEPAIRPIRNILRVRSEGGFDIATPLSLVIIIVFRYFILPRILKLIILLLGGSGF